MPVIKDAAYAARLVAVGQKEVFVAPGLVFAVPVGIESVAGALQRGVKHFGVRGVLAALVGEKRRQVGAAAEPGLGGGDKAGVHVNGGHARAGHVRDQTDSRRKESGIFLGARHGFGELFRKTSKNCRDVDPDFFEKPAMHHGHDAAAARLPAPGRPFEASGRGTVKGGGGRVLQRFKGRANLVAQALEPGAGPELSALKILVCAHGKGSFFSGRQGISLLRQSAATAQAFKQGDTRADGKIERPRPRANGNFYCKFRGLVHEIRNAGAFATE